MSKKKGATPAEIEAQHASQFSGVISSFNRAFLDFFDDSINSFTELKQLHHQQQSVLQEYNKFLKSQLKHSLNLWGLLLNAYSFFLNREEKKNQPEEVETDEEDGNKN